jgi:hypothetical protein
MGIARLRRHVWKKKHEQFSGMKTHSLQFAKHLNERGLDFEEYCADFLRERGYTVRFEREHEIWDADLVVEPGIEIDVKGSHLRKLKTRQTGLWVSFVQSQSQPSHPRARRCAGLL